MENIQIHQRTLVVNVPTIAIRRNKDPFGWMSNMSPFPIGFRGKMFKTSEALFQCLRFVDDEDSKIEIIEQIRNEDGPMQAKFVAKNHIDDMVFKPQSDEDVACMRVCLLLKIMQHPELAQKLVETGDTFIVEDCTKRQQGSGLFWGAALKGDEWIGKNMLGKLWMDVRSRS